MRLHPSSPKPPSQGMISGYPKGPLGVRWATCFGNRTIVHRQTFRLVVEGCSKIDFCHEPGRIMKCWFCDSDARGTCAACGRGLCHQHAHIHDEMTFTKTDTSPRQDRAAVNLLHQAIAGEDLEVSADGHVRNAEALSEIADPGAAIAPDGLQDERLAVSG